MTWQLFQLMSRGETKVQVLNRAKIIRFFYNGGDEPKMGIKRLIYVNTIKNAHQRLKSESEKTLILKFKLWKLLKK